MFSAVDFSHKGTKNTKHFSSRPCVIAVKALNYLFFNLCGNSVFLFLCGESFSPARRACLQFIPPISQFIPSSLFLCIFPLHLWVNKPFKPAIAKATAGKT